MTRKNAATVLEVGSKYGKWVIIELKHGQMYLCKCECGTEKEVWLYNLTSMKSTMCRSCASSVRFQFKWDRSKHPRRLTKSIEAAINRCANKEHPSYPGYGGRGIRVHEPWLKNPVLFVEYLMTLEGHDSELLLDRIKNNGHYEPGNLRFTDASTSSANTREHKRGKNGKFIRTI